MSKEVMKLALSTLEGWANYDDWVWPESALEQAKRNTIEAITALRERLAQPEQEPVAWMHNFIEGGISIGKKPTDLNRHPDRWTALYKDPTPCKTWHQPEQQKPPLTDEQIEELLPEADGTAEEVKRKVEYRPGLWADEVGIDDAWSKPLVIEIIRAVEKHHGIGGKA